MENRLHANPMGPGYDSVNARELQMIAAMMRDDAIRAAKWRRTWIACAIIAAVALVLMVNLP